MLSVILRQLGLTSFTICLALFVSSASFTQAAGPNESGDIRSGRIDLSGVRPVNRPAASVNAKPSQVVRAALGETSIDPAQSNGGSSIIWAKSLRDPVIQVGFMEEYTGGCGPVCDCDQFSMGPGCGAEPACGFEPGCGFEPNYGIEPSCGLDGGCGMAGCTTCEPACGMESMVGCGGCGECSQCCTDFDSLPIFLPILRPAWCRFDFFAGVQAYKGPMNFPSTSATNNLVRSGSGSFGFYQGFNEGRSLRRLFGWDMAAQFGLRATQSNLTGAEFTDTTRHQIFLTGGLFRRVDYGLQYGVVMDYLNDDWYFHGDLIQLRGELSWKTSACHEFGIQFMSGLNDDTSATFVRNAAGATVQSTVAFEATDQIRGFYRQQIGGGGHWDAFIGGSNNSDTVIGTTMSLPVHARMLVQAGGTYLIPSEGASSRGYEQESWNISLGIVFRPGGPDGFGRYCRPMFDVADNGTFMVDRR